MAARYRLLACDVLREEAEACLAAAPAHIEPVWVEQGLHDEPAKLNAELRRQLADCRGGGWDAVLLLYGLCSNAVLDLEAPGLPLVIPRIHDCISLYLGSARRYAEEHERTPGTYWFSRGFLHRRPSEHYGGGGLMGHAVGEETFTPARREALYRQYCEEYGEENAAFLIETWVDAWKRNYSRAVFLAGDAGAEEDRRLVRGLAAENGWAYEERPVDLRLLRMLLAGDWPESEFLVVPPGGRILASHDAAVLGCGGCGCGSD